MAKSIIQRILSNTLTRVGTNMLTRALTPEKPLALRAMPPVAVLPSPRNPQRTYYANTAKGFVRKHYDGTQPAIEFTPDMRKATPFKTFKHADDTAKFVIKTFPKNLRYFVILQPTIGQ